MDVIAVTGTLIMSARIADKSARDLTGINRDYIALRHTLGIRHIADNKP